MLSCGNDTGKEDPHKLSIFSMANRYPAIQRTNILIIGLIRSGSHALVDLLKEYDKIAVFPGEFDDFRAPGMVADQLDENLSKVFSNMIDLKMGTLRGKKRVAYQFLEKNIQKIDGLYPDLEKYPSIDRLFKRFLYRHSLMALNAALKSDITLPEKIAKANQWVQRVGQIYCGHDPSKDLILFDQPVTWQTNPETWTKVLNPFKMILSMRNPKDQLANVIKDRYLARPYGAPLMNWGGVMLETLFGRCRHDALCMFIQVIEKFYKRVIALSNVLGQERFMMIQFEDIVGNYEKTKGMIEEFLGLDKAHHIRKLRYLNPESSAKNIGYHDKYLEPNEIAAIGDLELQYLELKKLSLF